MSDPRDPNSGPPIDSDAFEEWVEHTASARGVDEQELLNQLVSAFWVLDEMSGVTGENDAFGTGRSEQVSGASRDTSGSSRDTDAGGDDGVDTIDFGSAIDDPSSTGEKPATEDRGDARSGSERDTVPNDASTTDNSPSDDGSTGGGDVSEEIRALRESLHSQLEMVQAVGELRRQLSDLSLDVENQRSRQDQFTDRISDDLTRLHSRIKELESQTEELAAQTEESKAAGAESVDRLARELRDDIESLEATQREFESWIDTEFDEIEGLFEHLLKVTDELDDRLATVETEVETIREETTQSERLEALRRKAQRAGVKRASCEACEAEIDISMLDEPHCPECDAQFEDIDSASRWNPFAKATLRTDTDPSEPLDQFN